MDVQNFFYVVASISLVLIGIFSLILLVIAILFALRLFKFSKSLTNISQKSEEILEKIRTRAKLITLLSFVKRVIKEFSKKNKKKTKEE